MRIGVGLPGVALVFAVLAGPGCLACRPPVPLDDAERAELESIRGRLRAREVRIVAPLESDWWSARKVLRSLEEVGLDVYRSVQDPRTADVRLELRSDVRPACRGSAWGSLLTMLTIGIVPDVGDSGESASVRWTREDGSAQDDVCAEELPTLFGWVAPIVATGEDWQLGGCSKDESPERRALLTRFGLHLARRLDAFVGETVGPEEGP